MKVTILCILIMEVTFHHYCHILLIRNRSQVPSTFKERVLEKGRIPEVGDHWGPCGAAYHREQKGRVDIYFFLFCFMSVHFSSSNYTKNFLWGNSQRNSGSPSFRGGHVTQFWPIRISHVWLIVTGLVLDT